MNFYRDTFAYIDLTKFRSNLEYLKRHTNKKLIAVIKANGYGHGAYYLAKEAIEADAEMLAVSSLDEAITLRFEGITGPILILGYTRPADVSLALHYDLILTATSLEWVHQVKNTIPEWRLKVHLKFDSGMNRLGMRTVEEIREALDILAQKTIQVQGIYTHYASSDEEDNVMTDLQTERFASLLKEIDYPFTYIHASNSDASIHYKEAITNAVRVGIAMIGVSSYESELQPILSLYSRVTNVKRLKAGEGVSYSQTYHATQDEWIGTIPIGYADGWVRQNQGRFAYLGDIPCEFIGRICMDQCMIRLPYEVEVDTTVELIGDHVSLVDIAKDIHTIPYEVTCLLTDRIPRIYLSDGKIVAIDNPRMRYNHSR